MKFLKLNTILALAAAAACGTEAQLASDATNSWPTLVSITANPAQAQPGGTVQVTAVANDPDSDPIAYAWSDDCGGQFADATSASTTWTAPASPATCNLTVKIHEPTVPAHNGAFVAESIGLQVTAPRPVAVYQSIPSPIPPSLVSESYQATATSQFGDSIRLAGTARKAASAKFVMVTWATGAYAYPITLNLYRPDDLVHPFATRTQQFDIPARPPADPSCSDGRWLASDGCHYGYAFPITFDLTGVTLPDTFVYGIALDTQSYGAQPTGQDGYYNSLNIGLVSVPPASGTRVAGTVYQDSSWPGAYQGTGTPGSFGPDTGWSLYAPAEFLANE